MATWTPLKTSWCYSRNVRKVLRNLVFCWDDIARKAVFRGVHIFKRAIVATLKGVPHLEIWCEPQFRVSDAADRLADSDANALGASLPYNPGRFTRTLQIDLLVYNHEAKRIGAYESKRGFGYHDAGKKRSMLRDLRCTRMLLKSYGQVRDQTVDDIAAHVIFYYGQCSLGKPWALTRNDLDEHFGCKVEENIERVNEYFRRKLDDLLASI